MCPNSLSQPYRGHWVTWRLVELGALHLIPLPRSGEIQLSGFLWHSKMTLSRWRGDPKWSLRCEHECVVVRLHVAKCWTEDPSRMNPTVRDWDRHKRHGDHEWVVQKKDKRLSDRFIPASLPHFSLTNSITPSDMKKHEGLPINKTCWTSANSNQDQEIHSPHLRVYHSNLWWTPWHQILFPAINNHF